ncbi:MAG TPA: RNA pyrophosphohydrolase [Caulobacteraceae bacterium]|nr:RNA pyrophosphohydrolase [Caulobacteraceae bacterium]
MDRPAKDPRADGGAGLSAYRPNVGVVLASAAGRVWLGRRAGAPGPHNWQFPQGGVDEGEDLLAAALRELKEETGVTSVAFLGRTDGWITYNFPPGHGGDKARKGWRGQRQVWFAFRFEGSDSEIDLEAHGEIEFDAWKWASLEEALEKVVAFKRETYRKVAAAFGPMIAPGAAVSSASGEVGPAPRPRPRPRPAP